MQHKKQVKEASFLYLQQEATVLLSLLNEDFKKITNNIDIITKNIHDFCIAVSHFAKNIDSNNQGQVLALFRLSRSLIQKTAIYRQKLNIR